MLGNIFFNTLLNMELYLYLFILWTSLILSVGSQCNNEYVLLFMNNFVEDATPLPVEIYIATNSNSTSTVTIENPNPITPYINIQNPILIQPNTVYKAAFPTIIRQSEDLSYKAIRVCSSNNAIVYGINRNYFSTDGFTTFEKSQLGLTYFAVAYHPATYKTQLGIAATEPGITYLSLAVPQQASLEWQGRDYGPREVISLILNRYQTAFFASTKDLTGAYVSSSQKIAVFSGNDRTAINGTSRDHLVKQLPPVEQWGYSHVVVRDPKRTADRPDIIRIVAHNDTWVEVTGAVNSNFFIGRGSFRELWTYGALYIKSNITVMVAYFASSQSLSDKADIGDPSMLIIPPIRHFSADYTFATPTYSKPPGSTTDQYDISLIIVGKSGEVNGLRLNGASLGNVVWTSVASSSYVFGYVQLENGKTYTLRHPTNEMARYMAYLFGSADRESFYFPIVIVANPILVYGQKGEKGQQGEKGAIGVAGLTGSTGVIGDTGLRGDRGRQGEKGIKGDPGISAPLGMQGATGATGATGDHGLAGIQGAVGVTGLTGATGPSGSQGSPGSPGLTGPGGGSGLKGDVGAKGYRGVVGDKGDKGDKGIKGALGQAGPTGELGDLGYIYEDGCSQLTCTVKDSSEKASCSPVFGSVDHTCSCPTGYQLSTDWNTCLDVNECILEYCSHDCLNTIGSYQCQCPTGYLLVGNTTCIDVDECEATKPCVEQELCINTVGNYRCLSRTSDSNAVMESLTGLQVLFKPAYFITVLVMLCINTVLMATGATCLLFRHRKRYRLERRRKQLAEQQARSLFPASAVVQDGYY